MHRNFADMHHNSVDMHVCSANTGIGRADYDLWRFYATILIMKFVYLLMTLAVLAACGGGGGVSVEMPPTDNMPTPPVDMDRISFQSELANARTLLSAVEIPESEKVAYTTLINTLEKSLQNETITIAELRILLADILQDIQNIPPVTVTPPPTVTVAPPTVTVAPPTIIITPPTPTVAPPTPTVTPPIPSEFNTEEYQANPMYESMNALYAYDRGYSGQGVTVAIFEFRPGFAVEHPDLAANYITTTINGERLAKDEIVPRYRLTAELDNFHGAAVAGILGAVRNGEGIHGIAPEVKMIPLSFGHRNTAIAAYLRDNNIPIINNSFGGEGGLPVSVLLTISGARGGAIHFNDLFIDSQAIWVWAAGNERESEPSPESLYPHFYPRLQTLWLSAMAVDENNAPRFYTNSCGEAKNWCMAAAEHDALSAYYDDEDEEYRYRKTLGTSIAAPLVSGALAILYGAIGMDSPQLARAILLTTATDLGDEGVDDIYGWGLVNISAGIKMIESMKSAGTQEFSAVSFADLRGELPSGFAHLHNELSAIKLAIKLTTDLYYNVALSEMLTPGDAPNMPLGKAATDMLANAESESRRGFFAYGDINTELGLRYYGGKGGFNYIAEGNQSATNNFSGNFGGIGGISGKTYGGKFGFTKAVKVNMQIFADYERAKIIGKGEEGNLIKGARNARAESWAAGISFTDIWKYGDRIRLSANQEMKLSGGELIVRYPHAVGDFHKTFTGEETQKIEIRETFLPLKQKAIMHYTAGYAQKINKKSEWATAIEYNAGNKAKAISIKWQGEF